MSNEITIVTPEQVELKFELAGLGSRFVAAMTDTLIQGLLTAAVLITFMFAFGESIKWVDFLSNWVFAIMFLFLFALWGGYFLFFEIIWNGQTPGKKSAGIRVIRDTGHPVDFRSALLRNVMRIVDILPGMYGIGMVSIFVSPQCRRLGDYVAGTLVVKTQQKPKSVGRLKMPKNFQQEENPAAPDTAASEPLLPPEVMPYLSSISRDDYRAIRHFLDRRKELEGTVCRTMAVKLSGPLAGKLHVEPAMVGDPIIFLENLSREWERRMIH